MAKKEQTAGIPAVNKPKNDVLARLYERFGRQRNGTDDCCPTRIRIQQQGDPNFRQYAEHCCKPKTVIF